MAQPQPTELANVENANLKQLQQISFETTSVANPQTLQEYINIAKMLAASGFYPDARTAQQAVALMILGSHFGLSPVQSLTAIHIVKGKPMLHYSAILAKVRQHPDYDYRIVEHTDKTAVIKFFHRGQECGESVFTDADARKAGTQNMEKHAKTMLLARAASNGVKWYCPDVLNGMPVYVQGEIPEQHESVDAGMTRNDRLKAELESRITPTHVEMAEEVLPAEIVEPEGWTLVFSEATDAKLQAIGMDHKEATEWLNAGVTEGQAKIALQAKDIEKVREKMQEAVNS